MAADVFDAAAVLAQAQHDSIAYIDLQFTDVSGMVKAVHIPARQLERALAHGVWFDGSALEGFARVAESDMYLRPDPATYALLPWESGAPTARLICDVYTPGGEPFSGDPRGVLRRAAEAAAARGYRYVVAPELEFYLFRRPAEAPPTAQPEDGSGYFDMSTGAAHTLRRAIIENLDQMGIAVDSGHHEVGGGQQEIDLAPREALHMADAIMTARLAVKSLALRHGLIATFMPKPLAGVAGSGMHMHQALIDAQSGQNAFAAPGADYNLSAVGRSFLAGQLAHARGICALLAPLVNSYKRLVAGLEAPVYITWAQRNRAALIRVPRTLPEEPERVRIELRSADPACNPYLALAAMLHAGLDGISREMALPAPAEEELYIFDARRRQIETLPISLYEALRAMESSDLATHALGLNIFERFLEAKRIEWDDYALEVSQWELARYLETY